MSDYAVKLTKVSVTPLISDGRRGNPILRQIDLQLNKGEWMAVIGSNGSGKSTLAKAIAGMPLVGLSGNVERPASADSAGAIPIVMQQPDASLIGATPWEDAILMLEQQQVPETEIRQRAEDSLSRVGLAERMHQPVETLSGGQKQLTALAGCLAAGAEMLLFDEATSMLDPEASLSVLEQARRLHAEGAAVVWVTQRLEETRGHDRLLVMDSGRLAYDGRAADLFRRSAPGVHDSSGERIGLTAPYSVRVLWELEKRGVKPSGLPLNALELAEEVIGLGLAAGQGRG